MDRSLRKKSRVAAVSVLFWVLGDRGRRVLILGVRAPARLPLRSSLILGIEVVTRFLAEDLVRVVRALAQLGVRRGVSALAGEIGVEHRHQVLGQQEGHEYAADDDDRQGLLRL